MGLFLFLLSIVVQVDMDTSGAAVTTSGRRLPAAFLVFLKVVRYDCGMIQYENIMFSGHAVQRMFERKVSRDDVHQLLNRGEIIAEYPEDKPFPSLLLAGWVNGKPLHVVAAMDKGMRNCYIVTVYIPSSDQWSDDYKTRR
jgi:hypothetical protein